MIIPNRIVQNQLMIAVPPIVAHSLVLVNYQCINAENLETSCNGKASLSGTWYPSEI
jgi:hypothetical protein